jgi:hypothetical protein
MLRRWTSRHPVGDPCHNDDSTTRHRILPIMMEESNQCRARKDNGGRKIKQVVNHSTAGGGPQSSATHSFRQEHCKTCQEPQGNHQLW